MACRQVLTHFDTNMHKHPAVQNIEGKSSRQNIGAGRSKGSSRSGMRRLLDDHVFVCSFFGSSSGCAGSHSQCFLKMNKWERDMQQCIQIDRRKHKMISSSPKLLKVTGHKRIPWLICIHLKPVPRFLHVSTRHSAWDGHVESGLAGPPSHWNSKGIGSCQMLSVC